MRIEINFETKYKCQIKFLSKKKPTKANTFHSKHYSSNLTCVLNLFRNNHSHIFYSIREKQNKSKQTKSNHSKSSIIKPIEAKQKPIKANHKPIKAKSKQNHSKIIAKQSQSHSTKANHTQSKQF